MKQQYAGLVITIAAGFCSFNMTARAAPPTGAADAAASSKAAVPPTEYSAQLVTDKEMQTRLLNTLDNAEGIAAGIGMTEIFGDQLKAARERVLTATPEDLESIPPGLYSNLALIEVGTGNMRLMYDPALRPDGEPSKTVQRSGLEQSGQGVSIQGVSIQSATPAYDPDPLDEPAYPEEEAVTRSFERKKIDKKDKGGDGKGDVTSACQYPGTAYAGRAASMNVALVANAIRDVMGQVCNQDILGENASLACIPFEVVADVLLAVDDNLALCNEHLGAAEVSATWQGLKKVHGNVQNVHDDLAVVDSELLQHDTDVRKDVAEHDGDVKSQLSTHDTDIKSGLASHDADMKSQVATHDADIKSQLTGHDTDLKTLLAQHDADIKARIAAVQATANETQRLVKVSMSRQLELLRLEITPEGKREIDPDVLSCTGDDCPQAADIFSCPNGAGWPCQ